MWGRHPVSALTIKASCSDQGLKSKQKERSLNTAYVKDYTVQLKKETEKTCSGIEGGIS